MKKILQYITVTLLKGLSFLPFPLLYGLADVLYVVLRWGIRYRSSVIEENLKAAFPGKSDLEIRRLCNRFYRNFCDITVESIKTRRLSPPLIRKRVHFKGVNLLNEYAKAGNGAIILAFHFANWEWASALALELRVPLLMVYNKMRDNEPMDDFLKQGRERFGGQAVQMGQAPKRIFRMAAEGQKAVSGLIADQRALQTSKTWATFLGREAAFFAGPEKIARRTNQPVFFQKVKRIGRGRYEYEYVLLHADPSAVAPNRILLDYIKMMEQEIKNNPECYLWSHKRWKHKRPAHVKLVGK